MLCQTCCIRCGENRVAGIGELSLGGEEDGVGASDVLMELVDAMKGHIIHRTMT